MRQDMKYFLESIPSKNVVEFIILNMKKDGLDELFTLLDFCNEGTQDYWHDIYFNLMQKSFNK